MIAKQFQENEEVIKKKFDQKIFQEEIKIEKKSKGSK